MREGSYEGEAGSDDETRRRAAGLLLRLVRESGGRTQKELARELHLSEDQVGNFEKGLLPKQDARRRYLELAAAYHLWPSLANRFLALLGQGPMTAEERQQLKSDDDTETAAVRLLFSAWHECLRDSDVEEIALALGALAEVSAKQGILKRPIGILAEQIGAQLAQSLIDRGSARSLDRLALETLEPIEGLLAEIADDRVKELERRVKEYIGRGAHTTEGEELAIALRDLIRVAPRRWRPRLRYLQGWLHIYSQSYVESVEELSKALHEFDVSDDDLTSLRTLADATFAAALAYMNVGDRYAFERAQRLLRRAETLYEDLEQTLPSYSRQVAFKRLDIAFQRARILTWGYRRGMGAHFEEAEEIYKGLLEGKENRDILEADPFLRASVLKERADNLRVGTEPSGNPHVPERAREYFLQAIHYYDLAQVQGRPGASEGQVECCINRGYIHRLLGNQAEARRQIGRAHRMSLSARLMRQIGNTLLQMAEQDWRSTKSRVFAAYVGAAISAKIGGKRGEDVGKEIVARLSPAPGDQMAVLTRKAATSRYAEFI